jgi:hypothetical protein
MFVKSIKLLLLLPETGKGDLVNRNQFVFQRSDVCDAMWQYEKVKFNIAYT